MLFNSLAFVIFAAVFYPIWRLVAPHKQARWIFLTAASLLFYGWWDWRFVFLLMGTGLIDYFAALGIVKYPQRKKFLLTASMLGNMGTLAVFKYSGFFTQNANYVFRLFGIDFQMPIVNFILPVGISFYTFNAMSYTIDVYKGQLAPVRNVLHYYAFLSMFPHLVAGPIIRAADILPQLATWENPKEEERWEGLRLIAHGYFKKMVIADNLAPIVNAAFNNPGHTQSLPYWWVIVSMFAVQIYCDFSGYSDIARGLARWMGYKFPLNFNHPYTATSIKDFWNRWHISLSTWFRDYVYIPLGGSRKGKLRADLYMWITMVVSGFWHGAAWHFIIWGALHAFYMSLERITKWPKRVMSVPGGRLVATLIILVQVWIAWVFFRAGTTTQAIHIVGSMFNFAALDMAPLREIGHLPLLLLGVAAFREVYVAVGAKRITLAVVRWQPIMEPVAMAMIFAISIFWRGSGNAFIYFQF